MHGGVLPLENYVNSRLTFGTGNTGVTEVLIDAKKIFI